VAMKDKRSRSVPVSPLAQPESSAASGS
jgi:hypothetical protein